MNFLRLSQYLTAEDFNGEFRQSFSKLELEFFKFERLQSYSARSDPAYALWMQGKTTEAIDIQQRLLKQQSNEILNPILERGVKVNRLRVVERPMHEYLKYEFETYKISSSFGENIRCVEFVKVSNLLSQYPISDFIMFDDTKVLAHDYSGDGVLLGGHLITDRECLNQLRELKTKLIAFSIPFFDVLSDLTKGV